MAKDSIEPPQREGNDTLRARDMGQARPSHPLAQSSSRPPDLEGASLGEEQSRGDEDSFSPNSSPDHSSLSSPASLPSLPQPSSPTSLPSLPQPLSPVSLPHPSSLAQPPNVARPHQPPAFPPDPYGGGGRLSVEELHRLAVQDSANNNVDENSNDQQYDRYGHYPPQPLPQPLPTLPQQPSVRPRVRVSPGPSDEPDRVPQPHPDTLRRRSSGSLRTWHRRNLSEDLTCSPSPEFQHESRLEGPHHHPPTGHQLPPLPLPPHNQVGYPEASLPSLHSASTHHHLLPLRLWGEACGPQPPPSQPSPEDVTQGAEVLLLNFTAETLRSNNLRVPDSQLHCTTSLSPQFGRAGQELRRLADKFAETEERKQVRCMAETVNMSVISQVDFFALCSELFMDGITRERIVALFTFFTDVVVNHVRLGHSSILRVLLDWALAYLRTYICQWVEKSGGWVVVLCQGATLLYRTAVFTFCVLGTVAAGMFIHKMLKDW